MKSIKYLWSLVWNPIVNYIAYRKVKKELELITLTEDEISKLVSILETWKV